MSNKHSVYSVHLDFLFPTLLSSVFKFANRGIGKFGFGSFLEPGGLGVHDS